MSFIFDAEGKPRSRGKSNLRNLLRGAKLYGGVLSIRVEPHPGVELHCFKEARVTVRYRNGWTAVDYFASLTHCIEWAQAHSASNSRASWFAGCAVVIMENEP